MTRITALLGVLLFCAGRAMAGDAAPSASDSSTSISPAATVIQHGKASVYSDRFQGKPTASGELHDQNALTAASKDLPLGATATVTNLENGKTVDVEITDRGPFAPGRVIDLSKRAASSIGLGKKEGTAPVRVEATAGEQPTPELQSKVAALSAKRSHRAKTAVRAQR